MTDFFRRNSTLCNLLQILAIDVGMKGTTAKNRWTIFLPLRKWLYPIFMQVALALWMASFYLKRSNDYHYPFGLFASLECSFSIWYASSCREKHIRDLICHLQSLKRKTAERKDSRIFSVYGYVFCALAITEAASCCYFYDVANPSIVSKHVIIFFQVKELNALSYMTLAVFNLLWKLFLAAVPAIFALFFCVLSSCFVDILENYHRRLRLYQFQPPHLCLILEYSSIYSTLKDFEGIFSSILACSVALYYCIFFQCLFIALNCHMFSFYFLDSIFYLVTHISLAVLVTGSVAHLSSSTLTIQNDFDHLLEIHMASSDSRSLFAMQKMREKKPITISAAGMVPLDRRFFLTSTGSILTYSLLIMGILRAEQ